MPSEDQIKVAARIIQEVCRPGYRAALNLARRVLEAVEGQWATATGGQEEDRLRGTPFESPSRVRSGSFGTDQLNSLAEKLMIALGDSTTLDTLTGDPGLLVDRIIAERDDLKTTLRLNADELTGLIAERDGTRVINKALLKERDALALDKASRDGLISDLQAEVAQLRAQLPSPPAHEIEIISENSSSEVGVIEVKCPYPGCDYHAIIQAPSIGLAHRMVDALAEAHETEEVDSGEHGPGRV